MEESEVIRMPLYLRIRDFCPNRVLLQVKYRSTNVLLSLLAGGECRSRKIQATRFAAANAS
jgi:hypothetical protein